MFIQKYYFFQLGSTALLATLAISSLGAFVSEEQASCEDTSFLRHEIQLFKIHILSVEN